MAYEKQTWETGDVITADKLNHMENGIASSTLVVHAVETETGFRLDRTWQEIFDANNAVLDVYMPNEGETTIDSRSAYPIVNVYLGNKYIVDAWAVGENSNLSIMTFAADTPNDYPAYTESENG